LTVAVEQYNGTAWTSITSLPLAKNQMGSGGNSTASVAFGGASNPPTRSATTDEFNDPTFATQTLTTS
jgi:hypothetical protein